jgi:Lrp/AsnC family leucine-responsive transcriptional regulator
MVPSGILERLRKLTEGKVILGYETRLDPNVLGSGLTAFVNEAADDRIGNTDTAGMLAKIPEVQEVHNVAGEDCYLLKIRAADPRELGQIVRDKVRSIKSVPGTKTTIILLKPLPSARSSSVNSMPWKKSPVRSRPGPPISRSPILDRLCRW